MMTSTLAMARKWPYKRYSHYQADMRTAAAVWFEENAFDVRPRQKYILADKKDWPKNLIVPDVATYVQDEKDRAELERKPFALHKYVHHGLSSQALLFNLMGPLIVQDDWRLLREIFAVANSDWPEGRITAQFEYENRKVFKEDYGQPTSIDMVVRQGNKMLAFVECKFTENEFGGCSLFNSGDCDGRNPSLNLKRCYLHFIGRLYWELLEEYGFLDGPLAEERACMLGDHYQFFRVLLFALEHKSPFILIYDDRSPVFKLRGSNDERGLMPFLNEFVPDKHRSNVFSLSIQEIAEKISESGHHFWIDEFKKKYALM